ncbi:MAG: hydrolase family protein [Homoserinimonas sp.]|nr:hydrolase family protein [Homoserinimonas sp.]
MAPTSFDPTPILTMSPRVSKQLSATCARMLSVLFTGPDIGMTPILSRVRGEVAICNENIRAIAPRHDANIADMWALRESKDVRMWAPDRLHFSAVGHHTVARMVLSALNVSCVCLGVAVACLLASGSSRRYGLGAGAPHAVGCSPHSPPVFW